jgi:hypothetical protein
MDRKDNQPDPWPQTLSRGYEWTHLRLGWVLALLVLFGILAIVMHVSLWYVLKAFANNPRAADQPRSVLEPGVAQPARFAPPLQPSQQHDRMPSEDLAAMHQREDQVFRDLGWTIDPVTHHATPPDALVRLVAGRRRPTSATAPSGGAK